MLISVTIETDTFLFYGLILAVILLIFFLIIDVHYFITQCILWFWCKIRRKTVAINETTQYYGICTTNDLDVYLEHMNNARYMRELDFARIQFYRRTGIYDYIYEAKGLIVQGANYIRYRKTIPFLTPYKVTTKVIYWDEKNLYFEHQFVQLSDGFVTTVILCKQVVLKVNVRKMIEVLTNEEEVVPPTPPPEFEAWIQLNKISSAKMRNGYVK